jgi:hypothetical protein
MPFIERTLSSTEHCFSFRPSMAKSARDHTPLYGFAYFIQYLKRSIVANDQRGSSENSARTFANYVRNEATSGCDNSERNCGTSARAATKLS